ncbi:hypothetical protein CFC21_073183 [Triticum aestivum]|uniref:Uncharacterized protein n=3 Tax=Triticum TaxID=4564 RepID=A0A9R0XFN1_TRITD|nr:uncharacterized protein LOC119311530 [Triticum dicoccoides]XP_044390073.1 uncharacterized protein LOC123113035 [Triticum aestivum]KAF7067275.1 hypothetical protein CFC21_073183 [Triticum aestivum]VAI35754.1 unnamed protein product [Triticum turgidum subsp. durum]
MVDSPAAHEKVEPATSLPEECLNVAILCKAFVSKVMNGLGALATIWATVVLLGGFAVLIKKQDFWYVTIVALVESIGILGGHEDPTYQIFIRTPGLLLEAKKAAEQERQLGWWRRRRIHRHHQQQSGRARRDRLQGRIKPKRYEELKMYKGLVGMVVLVALRLTEIAAIATCIVISSRRLKRQDYVDPKDKYAADHQNIKLSLNIFYGLVLAQSIIFIVVRLNLDSLLGFRVRFSYRLFGPSGTEIMYRYLSDNYLELIAGNVRATFKMNLITFAKKLVLSDSGVDDKLVGIRAMDRILRSVKYNTLALRELQASLDADAMGKLIQVLGLVRTPEEKEMRGHAARVVLKLAPDIPVDNCPRAMSLISSSLLETAGNMDVDLVWFGLRILDKLTDIQQNCWRAKDLSDLLPKIIDLTNLNQGGHRHGSSSSISDAWIEQEIIPLLQREEDIPPTATQKIDQQIIVGMSLKILSKLVATPGHVGEELREKTSECIHLLAGTILEHVGAARVIACLALDKRGKQEIGRSPEIIRKLKECLLSKAPLVDTTKVAANLLLLEYTTREQLNQIKLSIEEKNVLLQDPSLSVPTTVLIEALDLGQVMSPWVQSIVVQDLDLDDLLSAKQANLCEEAAKALVVLTSGCKTNATVQPNGCNTNAAVLTSGCETNVVLQEITVQEMETIVRMIFPKPEDLEREETRRMQAATRLQERNLHQETLQVVKKIIYAEGGGHTRSLHAKLLQNLRAHGHAHGNATKHMLVIDRALPEVMKAIVDEATKLEHPAFSSESLARDDVPWVEAGKVLDSFIGLTVQICKGLDASDFVKILDGVSLTLDTFVMKLKKILELYKYPTTEFPSIRRSTLELMNWMVRKNSNYREIFLQCGVYKQLKEVAKTARRLERFELFHCDVEVGNDDISSIHCLVSDLQKQLELCPHFEQSSHYYGAHAGAITVLVA